MIYEYRVYEATPGQIRMLMRVIETAMPFFEKHSMKVVGVWTTHEMISEGSNQLIYMLAFEDLAHLERAWKAFRSDPGWRDAHNKLTEDGKITYSSKFKNYVMAPTSYSPAQ
jgi:hypothetical protein